MVRNIVIVCMGLWTLGVQALPVVFTNGQYQTNATAIAQGQADAQSDSSPPTALPLITSATVVGTTDFASGSGVAASGLLTALSEASSVNGFASAVGSSEFTGDFVGGGFFDFHFAFTSQDFTDALAFSSGTLFLRLISNNVTLLDLILPAGSSLDRSLYLVSGARNSLDVLLSSESDTLIGGSASNFAQVTFQASLVPEPATYLLMLPIMLFVLARSRRSGTRRARA